MFRRIILSILLLIQATLLFGQNLVINPGFEDTVLCQPFNNDRLYCFPWYRAYRTPDYYRENCTISGCCNNAPNQPNGFQIAHNGISFLGFGIFDQFESQAREFIGGKLTDSLITGHKYCVELWVSPANLARYFTDGFGIYFSHDSVYALTVKPHINLIPQVQNGLGNVISDTAIWTQIYGEFYAQGSEQYLCIGNFNDDTLLTFDSIVSNTTNHVSYYYLDDVSVTDCTVGIQEPEKLKLSLSPNPVINKLYINLEMNFLGNIYLEIMDVFGKKMIHFDYNNGQRPREIYVGGLTPGMYFLRVGARGKSAVVKFLRE